MNRSTLVSVTLAASVVQSADAQITALWTARHPVGSSLSAGTQGAFTRPDGATFLTATSGPSSNTDVFTAAISGDQLNFVEYTSGPFTSEFGGAARWTLTETRTASLA